MLNTARVKVHEKICVLSVRGHTHRHTHTCFYAVVMHMVHILKFI